MREEKSAILRNATSIDTPQSIDMAKHAKTWGNLEVDHASLFQSGGPLLAMILASMGGGGSR